MQTLHKIIYTDSRSDKFRLHYLTDLHVGALACDEMRLMAKVEEIRKDKNARWIGGGDYIEAICSVGDRRYNEETLAHWLHGQRDIMKAQRDSVVEILKPIAHKCDGLIEGNHERAAWHYYARDIYGSIADGIAQHADIDPVELKLGVHGFVVYKFRRRYGKGKKKFGGTRRITVYCHHGWGGGRLPSGHVLALHRILGETQCELALVGHRHQQLADYHSVKGAVGHLGGGKYKYSQAVFGGSYLNAWINPSTEKKLTDTYVEGVGMAPVPLGTPRIEIKPDTKKITITPEIDGGWQRAQHPVRERIAAR